MVIFNIWFLEKYALLAVSSDRRGWWQVPFHRRLVMCSADVRTELPASLEVSQGTEPIMRLALSPYVPVFS